MDSSFREQVSGTQEAPKGLLAGLKILASLINWLVDLTRLTEEEREDAGIYLDRPGGE
ncbi:MAG: hypothetical protein JW730_21065 [Anaerolineales bacterium]|jgi:hypothetical protein|nr:hypothetical protein [Anaerolineales bacterium]